MTSRRPNQRITSAVGSRLVAALGCVAVLAAFAFTTPADADTSRVLNVTPSEQLTHGQYVDVSWTGFEPGRFVKIYLCPATATDASACALSSGSGREPGDEKVILSGAEGTPTAGGGSTPFIVKANDVVPISGADPFLCDAGNACKIVAVQLTASGAEGPFTDSASVDLKYALSTIPCPVGGTRIAGSGATSVRGAFREWQSEVCRNDLELDVSYTTTNSLQGIDAFVRGLPDSDFALSGVPLSAEDNTKLRDRGVTPVHLPITAGSLVFVYNVWYDRDGDGKKEQVKDLRLSPPTLAKLMQGRITSWDDPDIAADNPDHHFPFRRSVPVARADNSAATWWLTSYLWETAREQYVAGGGIFAEGPTSTFPALTGVILRTGTDAVARYVRSFPGEQTDENPDVPFNGFIGYVYLSEAQKLGLPILAIKNPAGNYVLPTTEAVTAGFAAGSVSADGIFTPDFKTTDPNAYPIPVASYLIAPTGDSKGVDAETAEGIGKLVMYTDDAGQGAAISRGYIPLPSPLKTAAESGVSKVSDVPAAELAPSSASVDSAPVSTDAFPIATTPPTFASADAPSDSSAAPSSPSVARRLTDAVPAAAEAILESPPAEAIKRAIAGVLGLSDVGFFPIGMPTMLVAGILLIILGRAVHLTTRTSARPAKPRSILRSFLVTEKQDADELPATRADDDFSLWTAR